MSERPLGVIARLQVQRDPLKERGVGYDPAGILGVDEAAIGPQGMVGRHGDAWVLDAHHTAHPRNRAAGRRALSIGFTGHYDRMAERFGSAALGCAGENVIVANDDRLMESDLAGTIVILTPDGDVELHRARVATPCAEFTSWIKGLDTVLSQREQPEDIAFLDDGMRGYILDVAHLEWPMTVRVGDRVVMRDNP
ncbi:MAG: hypothetical protein AAB198_07555 [Actinomycetota bacterium]